ncbi:N-acetylmuramoyl-L-alanine amidase [Bacillus sp. FSL K6-3431]|uniref:N-acetylmuramoyl-L-alanine amidase n=1 Tax=Bacillus sp. FSL K6-3431 TaxID=2921500 RepID=UPI0030F51239
MNKIKTSTTFLLAVLLIWFSCSTGKVYANEGSYQVGASSLNIRTEPDQDAEVIVSLPKGTIVHVSEIKYGWAKVDYRGKTGWIASQYLFQSISAGGEKIAISSAKSVTVAADGVRLRSGPGTAFSIVGYTSYGESFEVIETSGQWQRIRLDNGQTAWLASWLATTSSTSASPVKANGQAKQTNVKKDGSLTGKTIVIDAGHGGYDPGAIGIEGIFEKEYTLRTARLVVDKLKSAGAQVILTRSGDEYLNVSKRVDISRAYPSSVFISLHYNAHENATAQGISTYYYHGSDKAISSAIQKQLVGQTSLRNAGVRFGDFYVLRNNHQHSLLLELGFITNQYDFSTIRTQNYQHQVADAITQGLINYFN